MIVLLIALLTLLLIPPVYAVDVAVVQQAGRTTAGTADFTSTGFGTPVAAMCMSSYGVSNGTSVAGVGFTIGFTDGTRQNTAFMRSKDGVTTTVAGRRADTTDILYYADQDGTTIGRVQFSAWITDGVRLNWSVAPASAYQVSCTLFGGSGVTNAYVNTVTTPGVVDTSTTVNTVGFQPDLVIGAISGDGTYNDTNQAHADMSVGYAIRSSSQKGIGWKDVNSVTTTAITEKVLGSHIGYSVNGTQQVEIQNFTSNGFDATTRTTGAAATLGYLALKLNGLSVTGLAIDSPTATGSQAITGITGTPQWGMLIAGGAQSIDSPVTTTDAEVFGVSSFTSAAQSCFGVSSDDGVGTSNTDTVADAKPICLIKDNAAFYDASFTSFGSGAATFNYGTANGTTRKWVGLFLSDSSSSSFGTLRRRH